MGSNAGHDQANQMMQQDRANQTPFYQDSLNEYRRANAQQGELFDQLRESWSQFANGQRGYNPNGSQPQQTYQAPQQQAPQQVAPQPSAANESSVPTASITRPQRGTGDQTFGAVSNPFSQMQSANPTFKAQGGFSGVPAPSIGGSDPTFKAQNNTGGFTGRTAPGIGGTDPTFMASKNDTAQKSAGQGAGGVAPKTPVAQTTPKKNLNSYEISMSGFGDFANTGGYDDATRAGINSNIGVLSQLGQTGGLDAEAANRMRGGGVYDNLIQNGGISPETAALMKAQGQSSIGSTFQGLRSDMQRQNAAQGGVGFGFGGAQQALARTGARALGDQAVNTSLGIQNAINSGKLQGAQGMSSAENAYQGLRTSNMMQGANNAATQQRALQDAINQGMQWGLTQQQATKRAQEQHAEQQAAQARYAQQQAEADAFRQYQYNTQLQMQGLNALGDLRGQTPGASGLYGNLTGNSLGQMSNTSGQYAQANPYQNPWNTVSNLGGMIGGGLGSILR